MPLANWPDELLSVFQDAGVGTVNVNMRASTLPTWPDGDGPFLSVVPTGGTGPIRTQHEDEVPAYERPGMAVTIECADFVSGNDMAYAAFRAALAVKNQFIGNTWYVYISALNQPFAMPVNPVTNRIRIRFNLLAYKRPSISGGDDPVGYYVIDVLGGDRSAFVQTASAGVYPTITPGAYFSAIAAGSVYVIPDELPADGLVYFEISARLQQQNIGSIGKASLWNLDRGTMVANSELDFTDLVGSRQRSPVLSLSPDVAYGVLVTTNDTPNALAVWGAKLIHAV